MNGIKLEPYLFFNGRAKEAMEFYKSVFGGELSLQTHGEAMGEKADPKMKDKIMHAKLESGDVTIMASDDVGDIPKESARISLSLTGSDEAKMRQIFDTLRSGGTVEHPLEKQFWGDTFGNLRDQFGISWMVDILAEKA
ncbi:MAG TPA: VOC family protein [Candidatus Saccharimonadales bacterium]|nr:VOC family protein [Candidatus Saccharimonadales bacterium]